MFSHRLTDSRAFGVAGAMPDGFNRHDRLCRPRDAWQQAQRHSVGLCIDHQLSIDTTKCHEDERLIRFRFARACFMVDVEIPSAGVTFLCSRMPRKPRSELHRTLGLQKQGKNMFQRDVLHHLRRSSDHFRIAPGIQGMGMLVKQHDRVGRMADTLKYCDVLFPRARFKPELIERAVVDCCNAIKDLVAASVFPGDMLRKNFGVTRRGKVVFYDCDEIEYLTDCNDRRVPAPRNEVEDVSGEVGYAVGPKDVLPCPAQRRFAQRRGPVVADAPREPAAASA